MRYCSQRCKRASRTRERDIEAAVLALLDTRDRSASLCPSEVARCLAPGNWPPLMEAVRQAARRLAHAHTIVITQQGRTVDPTSFRGPIRLRRR